ncbi:unnamed protein product [Closterium sp. NIES-54]
MASFCVLALYHEGRPIHFDTWLDNLQLYLLSDSKDSVSLFDHTSGAAPAPPATDDSATRSQWLTRDAAARLAIRYNLQLPECAHFGQHRTAHALYDAVVARYSSPATAALSRLLLPYLFPELSAFATVEDLVSHLCASDAHYRAAASAEFLDRNQPPMFITLYFIVTRLPDSLRSVRDHFLSLDPTVLTVDLLEQHLLAAETSVVTVGAARGTPRTPFFEGCSPSPLAPSYTSDVAADVLGAEDVGAASASAKRRSSKGKGGRGGGGGSGGGACRRSPAGEATASLLACRARSLARALLPASAQQHTVECPVPQQRQLLQPVEALQQLTHPAGPIVKVVRLVHVEPLVKLALQKSVLYVELHQVEAENGDDAEEDPQRDVAAHQRVRLIMVGTAHLREALNNQPRLLALDGVVDAVLGRQHPLVLHDVHPAWAFDQLPSAHANEATDLFFHGGLHHLALPARHRLLHHPRGDVPAVFGVGMHVGVELRNSSSSSASSYNRSSSTSSYTVVKAAGGRHAWKLSRSGGRRARPAHRSSGFMIGTSTTSLLVDSSPVDSSPSSSTAKPSTSCFEPSTSCSPPADFVSSPVDCHVCCSPVDYTPAAASCLTGSPVCCSPVVDGFPSWSTSLVPCRPPAMPLASATGNASRLSSLPVADTDVNAG